MKEMKERIEKKMSHNNDKEEFKKQRTTKKVVKELFYFLNK